MNISAPSEPSKSSPTAPNITSNPKLLGLISIFIQRSRWRQRTYPENNGTKNPWL